jgi:hypothetical protein
VNFMLGKKLIISQLLKVCKLLKGILYKDEGNFKVGKVLEDNFKV